MHSFTFTKKSEKKLKKMDSIFKERLLEKLKFLKEVDNLFHFLGKLENMSPYTHRLRIGDMRILFMQDELDENHFYILEFGKRGGYL